MTHYDDTKETFRCEHGKVRGTKTCSVCDPVPAPPAETPPRAVIDIAVEQARCSTCRSQRGAVVFSEATRGPKVVDVYGRGHNRKPDGFDCDGSPACKATCRVEAVHAEQVALLNAGRRSPAARTEMLHVKVVDGALVPSGGPSCVQCSKLALAAGIVGVWLYRESGWHRYDASEFHRLSLRAEPSPAPSADTADTEQQIREYLWRTHGHLGIYGDDGEMQCPGCARYGVEDYKRAPLAEVLSAANKARASYLNKA